MTAKEFLKGTSGAKVSTVLQKLYLFFKEKKKTCKLEGLQYHQHRQ